MKKYTFLNEGFFFKSDEEVASENISKLTDKDLIHCIEMFIEYYSKIFFLFICMEENYTKKLYAHVMKYHARKGATLEDLQWDDLDKDGDMLLKAYSTLYYAYDKGILKDIMGKFLKHLRRFEYEDFKELYYRSGFEGLYQDFITYMKHNKLMDLAKQVLNEVKKTGIIQWLVEQRDEIKKSMRSDGFDLKYNKMPKSIMMGIKMPKLNSIGKFFSRLVKRR